MINYEGNYDSDYNVSTHNNYLPLRTVSNCDEDVYQIPSTTHGAEGARGCYYGFDQGISSGAIPKETYGQPQWGFPRVGQGVKRVVELREELEGGGALSPKRARM